MPARIGFSLLLYLFLSGLLAACGGGGGGSSGTPANTIPTASNVIIIDNNGGDAEVGDSLTGSYTFVDVDGDLEGTSTFRWLRNGTAISGATSLTYTLVSADMSFEITFEVTPVAATGATIGSAVNSLGLIAIAANMMHEATFDPVTEPRPAPLGDAVSTFFGSIHEDAQFAFNAAGEGMAVWLTLTGDSEKAVYATYDPLTSVWSAELTLFVVSEVSSPPDTVISLAASDTEFAVSWKVGVSEGLDFNQYNYAKVYSGGAWSAAMRLNATITPNLVTSPVVASNGTNFMFAWKEDSTIYSRSYSGSSLSSSSAAYSTTAGFIQDIELVTNGSGYALKLEDGVSLALTDGFMAVVLNNGGGWTTSMTTQSDLGWILRSNIASNGSGYMLTWTQNPDTRFSVYNGVSWSAVTDLLDVDNAAQRLSSSASDYLLSWINAGDLNVKAYSTGSWGSVIVPELLSGAISGYDVTETNSGYAFALQVNSASIDDLYLLEYNGGALSAEVAVDSGIYEVLSPTIAFDGTDTWLAWQQADDINAEMQLFSAAYTGSAVAALEFNLNKQNHGGGVNTGKVATTAGGIKVATWGQNLYDETGSITRAAYARVDPGSGWGAPILLENFANVRDIIAVGEDIVVLLEVGGGLDAREYSGGLWQSTFFTSVTSFVYNLDYVEANDRLVLVFETVNDIETVVYESSSWGTPLTMIESVNGAGTPSISTNGTDFLVTWKEFAGASRTINTRRYNATTGIWDTGSIIDNYTPTFGGGAPKIASDGSNFMVSWGRDDGTNDISLYTSSCDASGVCTAASLLESLSGNIGHYELASNGTGYAVAFAHSFVWGVTHDGVSWGAPINLGSKPGNQSLKLTSNGDGYLAAWYTFETNRPVYASRYTTTGGWSALASIKSATGSVGTFDWFQIYPVGLQYLVTWNSYKPGYTLQMKNLYTNIWNGSAWGGEQQINTGKFDVDSFAVDTTNNTARLSWVQAHESLADEAAKALWELVL